jgi:hypothetical protein
MFSTLVNFSRGMTQPKSGWRCLLTATAEETTLVQLLRPSFVRDEILGIAGETLRNSFRHAGVSRTEIDIPVAVRDDGKGIDPRLLGARGAPGEQELGVVKQASSKLPQDQDPWVGPLRSVWSISRSRVPRSISTWDEGSLRIL